ncbi:MAG TPA: hypothetical protein VFF43_18845 [Caldimonas sp.]|nr:hypothetical protein [Caldimonas sp.]
MTSRPAITSTLRTCAALLAAAVGGAVESFALIRCRLRDGQPPAGRH